MNIEQHTIDPLNAEITIHLLPEDYSDRFEKALKNYRKNAQMPGFRPGHVPASLIKQRFGKSLLADEINQILQDAINSHISENKLNVLGSPLPKDSGETGNWDTPSDFRFTYELGLAPQIEVNLDATQSFDYFKIDVNEELVNRQMKDYTRRYGEMSQPEESGIEDLLIVSLKQLSPEGEVIEGGISGQTTITIEYIKDETLRNKLIGLKVNDHVDVDPHAITENHEELAKMLNVTHHDVHSLDGLFRATVTDVHRIAPSELNQELFDKLFPAGEIASEEALRERVKSNLVQMFERDSDWLFKRQFAVEIVKRTAVQLPDEFLKKWIVLSSEKPLEPAQVDIEYPMYADSMRWQLIENEIIRKYEIKVGMEDAMAYVKDTLRARFASYGVPVEDDRLDEMAKETLGKKDEMRNVYDNLVESRIINHVKANSTLNIKLLPYDEFVHMVQH